ncbi:MAG: N-acetyltransferase family protein [Pseudomonadales bacterium]
MQKRDLPCVAELRSDISLQHALMASPLQKPAAIDRLQEATDWVERKEATGLFRIVSSQQDDAIGFVQICDIHFKSWAALNAAEAVARNDLGLFKLLLQVRSDNAQAIKLYERADWRLVGHLEAHYHDGEERHDAAIYEKVLAA